MLKRSEVAAVAVSVSAIVVLAMGGTVPASAGPGDFFGPGKLSIRGAAASQGENGGYGLGVWARTSGGAEDAEGQFRAGHRGPDGEYGMAGNVHCLSRDASGLIQVSGRIFGSGGQDFAGKDFAATVDVDSEPQRFSEVRIGEPDSLAPCSGGLPTFHDVSEGGYETAGGE